MAYEDQQKLLSHYQSRHDIIIKERINWLKDIEEIKPPLDEYQVKELELLKINDEILETQKNLSEANLFLAKERAKIIKCTDEIDNYKCKKIFY